MPGAKSWKELYPYQLVWVCGTHLEAALWVFFATESFEEGAIRAVNLGDDADMVAAVYGGLAGAWYADAASEDEEEFSEFLSGKVRASRDGVVQRELSEKFGKQLAVLSESLVVN